MKTSFTIILFFHFTTLIFSQFDFKTQFEESNFTETEDYTSTIHYFSELANISQYAELKVLGETPRGNKIFYFIVSKEKNFEPVSLHDRKKPLFFILNGIHSGEIEGKDASMLLLREIFVDKSKEYLLDFADMIFIPVFNVDGHERTSPYNRINQNGPANMGWRTTSQNFNLNRDWLKADSPEMTLLLGLYSHWLPDFMVDNHTTNGADYQYTVTYGVERHGNIDRDLGNFVNTKFLPYLIDNVEKDGFLVAPYVTFKDRTPESGLLDWASQPRFSGGYNATQNRISLLVETHMMKPFKERVFATKAVLESVINFLGANGNQLIELNKNADKNVINDYYENGKPFYTGFKTIDSTNSMLNFKGFISIKEYSEISGAEKVVYTDEKFEKEIPFYDIVIPVDSVTLPIQYIIPKEYKFVVEKLKLHGVEVYESEVGSVSKVNKIQFTDVKFAQNPYEGRHRVIKADYNEIETYIKVTRGDFIVSVGQRTARIIAHLLEPKSEDSFLRWGFFNHIFEQKEYFEPYVMERVVIEMSQEDPVYFERLKEEFEEKLANDPEFKNSPWARLNFFYKNSKYYDENYMKYPIYKVLRNQ